MKILTIAYYTGIKYFRNILALCFFLLAPFVFLYLMSAMINGKAPEISAGENIGFYSADTGEITSQFKSSLISNNTSDLMKVTEVSSLEDGIARIKSKDLDSLIFMGPDFTKKVKSGEKAEIMLYKTNNISAAKTLVESFANYANGSAAVVRLGGIPSAVNTSTNMNVIKVEQDGKTPSSKDMASVSCLLIFIFYGALLGSNSILTDLNKKTYIRLRCAPIRYVSNFSGQLLGNTLVMFLFTLISALAAQLVFGVNLKGNILLLLAVTCLFLVIINSLGILLARLTKNIYLCGLFTFALNYLMVFPIMGNAFSPGSGTIYDITKTISPHYYTYQALMGAIYKNGTDVAGAIGVLALMAILLCSASLLAGRRLKV